MEKREEKEVEADKEEEEAMMEGVTYLITIPFTIWFTVPHSHRVDGDHGHQRVPQLQQVLQLHIM